MKDIYELLNDVELDENEYVEMEVTKHEKLKVKKALRKSLNKDKKYTNWKRHILAASIIMALPTATIGVTLPTQASNIPVIGDLFKFFGGDRGGLYTNYKEFSTEKNIAVESNGIKITINDAIFDGNSFLLTFVIDSDHDLGQEIHIIDPPYIKGISGSTGGSKITKINEKQYAGIITRSLTNHSESGGVNLVWDINTIINSETGVETKGKWKFALSIKESVNQEQIIGESVEKNGLNVIIEKLSYTPMSFVVHYDQRISELLSDQWDDISVELDIKDDLGNSYLGEVNGGISERDSFNIKWNATFEKLEDSATKLFILPRVIFRNTQSGGVEINEQGDKEITKTNDAEYKEILLEEIIIQIRK